MTTRWQRLLAIATVVVVLSFSFLVVAHWHSGGYEDQQCRLCHFAHTNAIDLAHGATLPAPVSVHRAIVATRVDPQFEVVSHQVSSRAPPA